MMLVAQVFDLGRGKPLPPLLLPYMRVAVATSEADVKKVGGHLRGGAAMWCASDSCFNTELLKPSASIARTYHICLLGQEHRPNSNMLLKTHVTW
jgi:hypothetical protein